MTLRALVLLFALCHYSMAQEAANAPLLQRGIASAADLSNGVVGTGPIVLQSSAGGGLPSGMIAISLSACPAAFSEVAALNGKTLIGTLAANGDVGTGGGADAITPTGTVAAPVFTGSVLGTHLHGFGTIAAAAPTFAGSSLGTHTHTFTGNALGTHAHELPWQIPSTTTIRQIAVATFGTGTSRAATAVSAAGTGNTTSAAVALSQAVSGGTPGGSNSSVSAGTPAGTNSAPVVSGSTAAITAGTPAGTNSAPGFTGTQFDNRSAFIKVIFCQKD